MKECELFREEAVKASQRRIHGNVILTDAPSYKEILIALALMICIVILFISLASFSHFQPARGILVNHHGLLKVSPVREGIVTKIHVKDGDFVEVGDLLASVQTSSSQIHGSAISVQQREKSLSHLALLKDEKEALLVSNQFDKTNLKHEIEMLKQKISAATDRAKFLEDRIAITDKLLSDLRVLLETGGVSKVDIGKTKADLLRLREERMTQHSSIVELLNSKTQSEAELDNLPHLLSDAQRRIDTQIVSIEKQLLQESVDVAYEIYADNAGIVTNFTVREGERVTTDYPLMSIVPKSLLLTAELFVPSRAIGFVEVGQSVQLKLDAFPHQLYGHLLGTIDDVSLTLLEPGDWKNTLNINEPVYKTTVLLTTQHIEAKGKQIPLKNGLSLSADIVLENQSLLDYILSPFKELNRY